MLCSLIWLPNYSKFYVKDQEKLDIENFYPKEFEVSNKDYKINFHKINYFSFGTQAYWINKKYACEILTMLDKNIGFISENYITSELITRLSRGYYLYPCIVIEDSIYSTLRQGNEIQRHRDVFSQFGLENFSNTENEDLKKLWKPIGYNPLESKD